jgi:DMSO/TMAO reductase YedYZ molybdopterin-dependent catalytic subunit
MTVQTERPEAGDIGPGIEPRGKPVGRRVVLGLAGLGAAGILLGSRAQDWLERTISPLISKDGTGLAALLPVGRFRIYTVTTELPERSRADYRLRVHGLVNQELDLGYADLTAMTPTAMTRDFQCVTGWRVHDVAWKGVRLSDVLDLAGLQPEAKYVMFTSFDGTYTESLSLEQAMRRDVLVAYELEGDLLSMAHGGPVRLYVAPMYGYKSLKWLESIRVSDTLTRGYWEKHGYDTDAWVGESNGRDDDAV